MLGGMRGLCFGTTLFLVGAHWVCELGWPLWLALLFFPGSLFALYGAANAALLPRLPQPLRPFVFALGWALFECLRTLGVYAVPWFSLASAHAAPSALPLLQCVSVIGGEGFGFIVALVSALLAEGIRQRSWPYALGLLLPLGLLELKRVPEQGASPRLALLQAGEATARSWQTYQALTREAALHKPDLIVWPEGAATELGRDGVAALAKEVQTPLLVGTYEQGPDRRPENLALLYDSQGHLVGRYTKQRLAPFGEVYPFQAVLGGLYAGFGIHHESFRAGEKAGVLNLPSGRTIGVGICFESAFPWVARGAVAQKAETLVFLTSDQTFGRSAALEQHLQHAVVRAVENRCTVVQAATTGVSVVILPTGKVSRRLGPQEKGVLLR